MTCFVSGPTDQHGRLTFPILPLPTCPVPCGSCVPCVPIVAPNRPQTVVRQKENKKYVSPCSPEPKRPENLGPKGQSLATVPKEESFGTHQRTPRYLHWFLRVAKRSKFLFCLRMAVVVASMHQTRFRRATQQGCGPCVNNDTLFVVVLVDSWCAHPVFFVYPARPPKPFACFFFFAFVLVFARDPMTP